MHITETCKLDSNGAGDGAVLTDVRHMTKSELRCLGLPSLVYLRAGTAGGQAAYGIFAADGTAVAIVDDVELAIELVAEHGMTFATVH